MAHIATRDAYSRLTGRINRFPLGAYPSELFTSILELLFSPQEAESISRLPLRPFTVPEAACLLKSSEVRTKELLDDLADRGLMVDIERKGKTWYVFPPPMAGFFEFVLMRVRENPDQALFSELLYRYINIEEEFVTSLFLGGETKLGRIYPDEDSFEGMRLQVLDYERASHVIETASDIAVGLCYCRHKMRHVGRACQAPLDICLTLNTAAASLIRHGSARRIERSGALEIIERSKNDGLVQFGENAREGVNFICNCCPCCCEALVTARRFGPLRAIQSSNYFPIPDTQLCRRCGSCRRACPVDAVVLEKSSPFISIDETRCLGCGLCVRACPFDLVKLERRGSRQLTPVNATHRVVLMAIERGKLQDLLFDKHVLWSHRALAAFLGVVLRLPVVKKTLATSQLSSRFIEYLCARSAV